MSHEVVRIRSGALAIRCGETKEVMHPGVGPVAEAEALYVRQSSLRERLHGRLHDGDGIGTGSAAEASSALVLFDVGLGAGSNALRARAESERAGPGARRLELVSFERDLGALALALEHAADFGFDDEGATAARALLQHGQHESARTRWRLRAGDVLAALKQEASDDSACADIIFWDPFSPRANPQLWTVAAFAAVRARAAPGATLFTYSASTAVRAALLLAGWAVGVGDSVGDKAETTAAAVRVADLARPLARSWLARLALPSAPWPPDSPPDALAQVHAAPQFAA